MLVQAIDYYDYITNNLEGFARAYKGVKVDPTQSPRLFLIAPKLGIDRNEWRKVITDKEVLSEVLG